MHNPIWAHVSLFVLNLLYVLSYYIIKGVSPTYLHPSLFVWFRVLGAGALFWLTALFLKKGKKVEKQDHVKLFIAALFGIVFNQLCFFHGLVLTSSVNTSIIMTSTPILVFPIAAWMIKEKMSAYKIIGVSIGFVGALLAIMERSDFSDAINTQKGNTLVFINAVLFSVYIVYSKPLMIKYPLFTVLKWLFFYGGIVLTPFGIHALQTYGIKSFTPEIWWAVTYVILVITYLTFILNMYAIKVLKPTAVSVYIFTQPFLTSLFSWIFYKQWMSFTGVCASVLIFIGVYFVALKKS